MRDAVKFSMMMMFLEEYDAFHAYRAIIMKRTRLRSHFEIISYLTSILECALGVA